MAAASPDDNIIDDAGVVVWEFEGDLSGLFVPYSEKVSNFIEENYVKDKNCCHCKLGLIDPLLKDKDLDFTSMTQNSAYGSSRTLRRQIYVNNTIANGITWQWLTEYGWVVYDIETLDSIELEFSKGSAELDLESLSYGLPNIVEIHKGYQRNKLTSFVRPIQRVTATYKKVGLKDPASSSGLVSQGSALKRKLDKFCDFVKRDVEKGDKEKHCTICLIPFKEENNSSDVCALKKCGHKFHLKCIEALINSTKSQEDFLICPICKSFNGVKHGNQPPGKMDVAIDRKRSVAGYNGCGMIAITYRFHSGIQGPNHPNPGKPYHANGFPRIGYLPNNEKGKKVLKLLKIAFERKLTFTIDQSVTTGQSDCIVWNEIHHKTSPSDDYSGHGYPDANYLDNVLTELQQHNVTAEDL